MYAILIEGPTCIHADTFLVDTTGSISSTVA